MTDQMSTDALELYCRNRAKSIGELTEYDRLLFMDVSERLCALHSENVELQEENGCLRHNVASMQVTLDQQAKNCEELLAEKDKEIERLNKMLADSFQGHLLGELQRKDDALSRVEAERDAAKPSAEVLEAIDELVGFARPIMSTATWLGYVNVLNEWRGAQGEG